ncbi:MAG: glycosyltransferase family protein, partial [Imperialibacter sp.]
LESICEVMYLGKPVMMVPVQGHYEQACNALDAVQAGAGVSSESFNLTKVIDYLPNHQPIAGKFREWTDRCEELILKELLN